MAVDTRSRGRMEAAFPRQRADKARRYSGEPTERDVPAGCGIESATLFVSALYTVQWIFSITSTLVFRRNSYISTLEAFSVIFLTLSSHHLNSRGTGIYSLAPACLMG